MIKDIYSKIQTIVLNHIIKQYGANPSYAVDICKSLKHLLHTTYGQYEFPKTLESVNFGSCNRNNLQESLSKINEKESRRKNEGVYYTDNDVTDYMVLNSFYHLLNPAKCEVLDGKVIKKEFKEMNIASIKKILLSTVFDPTCGAGAFLISALYQKIQIYKDCGRCGLNIVDLLSTIKGNDIESVSTDITKLRLFFLVLDSFEEKLDIETIAKTICNGFYNVDVVDYKGDVFGKYDIVIGNPPYIEYGKYKGTISNDYGDVYADVMKNVVTMLSSNGVLAFVVPLSYISTARMFPIRNYVYSETGKQLLLNFADRPDCLFSGVHQKLTIVLAQKTNEDIGIYTSRYTHWYKSERRKLFKNIPLAKTSIVDNRYWPKLGDKIGESIFKKIQAYEGVNIFSLNKSNDKGSIYINQRACFWMKVFSKDMNSNSYKEYHIDKEKLPFVMCLLNSSLFFLLWTIISDGWHITNKEILFIRIPNRIPVTKRWSTLISKLENRLESTKEYVGTKQVDYEYKHKLCKDIIDEIDDELKSVYKLSAPELNYIKKFNEKYRMGDGA